MADQYPEWGNEGKKEQIWPDSSCTPSWFCPTVRKQHLWRDGKSKNCIWVRGFCAISWGSFLKMWLCFKDLWRNKDGNERLNGNDMEWHFSPTIAFPLKIKDKWTCQSIPLVWFDPKETYGSPVVLISDPTWFWVRGKRTSPIDLSTSDFTHLIAGSAEVAFCTIIIAGMGVLSVHSR